MNRDEKQRMTPADGVSGGDHWLRMVSRTRAIGRLAAWPVLAAGMLTACGGDGGGGNEDTLLTGLSGVVILGAVIWFVLRKVKSRG